MWILSSYLYGYPDACLDGYEATKQIRNFDRKDAKTIPIIALSANALADDVENALQAGMNEHIAKPIDMEAVWKILKKYITLSSKSPT